MKNFRKILWIAVAAAIIAASVIFLTDPSKLKPSTKVVSKLFGGPFVMTTHEGKTLTEKDLLGKPFAIFFGFTHCPEVCPTTLLEITKTIAKLGPDADKMNYIFVTIDPERDTGELMATYISNFDKRIIGLRGTPEQTKTIAKAYRVYYAKDGKGPDYNMNHTATTYLMNGKGKLVSTLDYDEDPKSRLAKVKRLISGG